MMCVKHSFVPSHSYHIAHIFHLLLPSQLPFIQRWMISPLNPDIIVLCGSVEHVQLKAKKRKQPELLDYLRVRKAAQQTFIA